MPALPTAPEPDRLNAVLSSFDELWGEILTAIREGEVALSDALWVLGAIEFALQRARSGRGPSDELVFFSPSRGPNLRSPPGVL